MSSNDPLFPVKNRIDSTILRNIVFFQLKADSAIPWSARATSLQMRDVHYVDSLAFWSVARLRCSVNMTDVGLLYLDHVWSWSDSADQLINLASISHTARYNPPPCRLAYVRHSHPSKQETLVARRDLHLSLSLFSTSSLVGPGHQTSASCQSNSINAIDVTRNRSQSSSKY